MAFEVIWTEPAASDLQSIIEYISQNNPTAAVRVAGDTIQRAEMLSITPLMGKRFPKVPDMQIREIVAGKYRIFYRVYEDEQRLEIMTIWHSARGDPNLSVN